MPDGGYAGAWKVNGRIALVAIGRNIFARSVTALATSRSLLLSAKRVARPMLETARVVCCFFERKALLMSSFMECMIRRATETPRRIALPEATSGAVLKLAEAMVSRCVATPVLVGPKEGVLQEIADAGINDEGFDYFDTADESCTAAFAEQYLARYSDLSPKALARRIADPLLCSMLLVKAGVVDGVAAGKELSTGEVVAAAMQIVGLAPGVESPSSLGIADIPGFDGPEGSMLALADCAITAQPDAEELAGIAIASADTASTLLGWEPRVAMLAFSTCGSAEHESIDVVREAVRLVHERRPDIACDGEFQLDAAILPQAAEHKVPRESTVAGRANVLVFPNLHAGNIGVKLVQIFGRANAYGPVLQGFAAPVCDFSRSAPLEEMLGNVAMLVVRAASAGEGK